MTTELKRILTRRGSNADWTAKNSVLSLGELGYETDTGKLKMGDGVTEFLSLPELWRGRGDAVLDYDAVVAGRFTFESGELIQILNGGAVLKAVSSGATITNAGGQGFVVVRGPEFNTRSDVTLGEINKYPDGTIGYAAGVAYEADSSATGSDSAGNDVSVDGIALYSGVPSFILPYTGPSGDNAPNIVFGSLGAVDLPSSTYGNVVQGPRNNDQSGGDGYRNRLGSTTNLSAIFGGDNDFDALAVFNMGHHNAADVADGVSHAWMFGTYLNNGGAYGINMGTENDNWSHKSAILSGQSHRIGTQGAPSDGRNSVVVGGYQCTIDGDYALAFGYGTKATADYSQATGYGSVANTAGERVFSSTTSGTAGARQVGKYHLSRDISGGVATQLLSAGSARAAIGSKSTLTISAYINAARTDVEGETASYRLDAQVSNMGGTLAVKSQSLTVIHEDVAGWNADIIVSGSTWQIRFQGVASQTFIVDADVTEIVTRNI